MARIIGIGSNDNTMASRKLYKDSKAKLMYMEPDPKKVTSNSKKEDSGHTVSLIEHFIEENSGEYNKKSLYAIFSNKINLKEFKSIIVGLRESGKIAIDRKGVIVWIWYPESKKEYLNPKNLVF